jgi:hypothetical protein
MIPDKLSSVAIFLLALVSAGVSATPRGHHPAVNGHDIKDGELIATGGPRSCANYCMVIERHGRNLVHFVYANGEVDQVLSVPLPAPSVRWASISYAIGSESRSLSIDSETSYRLATQSGETWPHDPTAPPAVPPDYTGTITASVSYVSGNYLITVTTTYVVVNGVIESATVSYTYRPINPLQEEK